MSAGRYPHGLAAAVLLALDAVRAGDGTGVCGAVMDLVSVLSAAGVPRAVLHAAGQAGALSKEHEAGGRGSRRRWWMRRWGGWPGPRC